MEVEVQLRFLSQDKLLGHEGAEQLETLDLDARLRREDQAVEFALCLELHDLLAGDGDRDLRRVRYDRRKVRTAVQIELVRDVQRNGSACRVEGELRSFADLQRFDDQHERARQDALGVLLELQKLVP